MANCASVLHACLILLSCMQTCRSLKSTTWFKLVIPGNSVFIYISTWAVGFINLTLATYDRNEIFSCHVMPVFSFILCPHKKKMCLCKLNWRVCVFWKQLASMFNINLKIWNSNFMRLFQHIVVVVVISMFVQTIVHRWSVKRTFKLATTKSTENCVSHTQN